MGLKQSKSEWVHDFDMALNFYGYRKRFEQVLMGFPISDHRAAKKLEIRWETLLKIFLTQVWWWMLRSL